MKEDNAYLVYVNPIGINSVGWYEYDFYFSETPNIVWGYGWDCDFAAQEEIQPPDK